jgi:hypothetical protein
MDKVLASSPLSHIILSQISYYVYHLFIIISLVDFFLFGQQCMYVSPYFSQAHCFVRTIKFKEIDLDS